MSTNSKNVIRPEFFKNFTNKVKERYILVEKGNTQFNNINDLVFVINQELNQTIQMLNLRIKDRQLPYITLKICYGNLSNKRIRVFIHNDDTDFLYERDVQAQIEEETEISHILDLLIASSLKKITISNLSCDAEIVIDYKLLRFAIIDILLDIVMFNSYSFLKSMDIDGKKRFSREKYDYYMDKRLECFYDCSEDKMLYYSISFSARMSESEFDLDKYIGYWDDFIGLNYPKQVHKEKSIKEQIKQHKDFKELPKNLYKKFEDKSSGAYLLLRTNKDRTEDLHPMLFSLFGIKKYRKGKIKIVPIEEFETYKPLMEHLDVSVFKIVKQ